VFYLGPSSSRAARILGLKRGGDSALGEGMLCSRGRKERNGGGTDPLTFLLPEKNS
jgi:hypothetical protein